MYINKAIGSFITDSHHAHKKLLHTSKFLTTLDSNTSIYFTFLPSCYYASYY
jgi:hypothetical protein